MAAVGGARRARGAVSSPGRRGGPGVIENPSGRRTVHESDELGGHGGARRDFTGRQLRGLPRRQGRATRRLGESGRHGQFRQPHARHRPRCSRPGISCEAWDSPATGRRSGSVNRAIPAGNWLMPLTGGMRRAFLDRGKSTPAWSADNTQLVYIGSGLPVIPCPSRIGPARTPAFWPCLTFRPRPTGTGAVLQAWRARAQSGLVTGRSMDLTSCTGRIRTAAWTCGASDPRASSRSNSHTRTRR